MVHTAKLAEICYNFIMKKKENLSLFVLAVGVVLVWRGVWGVADLFLFPNNQALSFLVSIVVGIGILYFNDRKLSKLL